MDKIVFIPSALLGIIFILIYWYRCNTANKEFNMAVMVNAILQSSGIVCGILLAAGTMFEDARELINEIDLYVFISGLVVLAASIKGLNNDVFQSTVVKTKSTKASKK